MMALVDRALALNPNFARGWHISGVLRLWAGEPDHRDRACRNRAAAQSPRPRRPVVFANRLCAFFKPALRSGRAKTAPRDPGGFELPSAISLSAACYAHMGRLDDAREIVARLRAITPVVVPTLVPYRNPEHRELYLSGLRMAAGETA